MDKFADIRPYNDAEVPAVLQRLLADTALLDAIGKLKFKRLTGLVGVLRPLVRAALHRELQQVENVHGFQMVVERYMSKMIARSTAGFTVSGLERLQPGRPCLFMSNHRDITLDPAFANYALYHNNFATLRIAIGDNLLTRPWVSDLMRLNKSFIVKRSARGPREVLKAYQLLSAYIRHSIGVDAEPVWIAQREGRAKEGIDRTEPAIIKMLAMSRDRRAESFAQCIEQLRLVPVAISYELDPCDALKAAQLSELRTRGHYDKAEHEDVASIAAGITGNKGQVHIAFGTPLGAGFATPEAVAAEVDRQIIGNYVLHATNGYAWRALHGQEVPLAGARQAPGSCGERDFLARMQAIPTAQRDVALGIYANAISSKLQWQQQPAGATGVD